MKESCVTATVEGAIARNFIVTVVEDAVVSTTDQSREVALTRLAKKDILILSSEQIFENENDKGEF